MSDATPTNPEIPLPPSVVATAGVEPDPWAREKALAHDALAALIAKLDETATRDQIVDESYALINALPLPAFLLMLVNGAKPVVKVLAERGAK